MSDSMKLALHLSATDMLSSVVARARQNVIGLGQAGRQVQRDFDVMKRSLAQGVKGLAVGAYTLHKALPALRMSGDLQEATLAVKANLAGSAASAQELTSMLKEVRGTAITVSSNAPFSAEDVVRIENSLLKAGMKLEDVAGASGAAFAATALASLSGEAPELVGDSLARLGSQFKLKGDDYKEAADWLVRVDDAAATSLPELIQGLRMSGSQAAALKIPLADAVTSMGALAPLGERAGSSYANFLGAITKNGGQLRRMKINLFEEGQFIGMARATDVLRQRFGAIENTEKRLAQLMKIFGEEGGRAANTFIDASDGFREIEESAKGSLSMVQKMDIWAEGMNASVSKLGGTAKSTFASLYDPLLAPITAFVDKTNEAVGKVGELAEAHKGVSKTVSYGTAAVALGGLGYGAWHLLKGGRAGLKGLKGAGGLKGLLGEGASTAVGIAKGKAIEAVAGVTPVYVVNMPDGFGGGGGGFNIAETLRTMGRGGGGGLLGYGGQLALPAPVKGGFGILPKAWLTRLAGMGSVGATLASPVAAVGAAKTAGAVAFAGVAGYAIGSVLEKWSGTLADHLSEGKYNGSGAWGAWLYDALHKDESMQNNVKMNVYIDKDDRVTTKTDNRRHVVETSVKRGEFNTWRYR